MNSATPKLGERLSTIHFSDPNLVRQEIVDVLREAIPCNVSLFFKCAQDEQGDHHFTAPSINSDPGLASEILPYCRQPAVGTPWLPPDLDLDEVNNFIRTRSYYDDDYIASFEVEQKLMIPLEIYDQMRVVLYDGEQFLGWLGMMRQGQQQKFRDTELEAVRAVFAEIKSALAAAEAMESKSLDDGLFAVMTSDGDIEHASGSFCTWSDDDCADYLRRRVRDIDGNTSRPAIEIYNGASVRLTRLDATGSVRYLVTVERSQLMGLRPEYWLTDRQREIAQYVAAGATNKEVADTLGLSHHTVKTHIKNIYNRLAIGSRVELVNLFERRGNSRR